MYTWQEGEWSLSRGKKVVADPEKMVEQFRLRDGLESYHSPYEGCR